MMSLHAARAAAVPELRSLARVGKYAANVRLSPAQAVVGDAEATDAKELLASAQEAVGSLREQVTSR